MAQSSEKISPTAYATGHLWVRLGLSHPALSTPQGRKLDRLFSVLLRAIGGQEFGRMMYARHVGIDKLLSRAIEAGRVGTVIEIAAGLSGRGVRMVQQYGKRIEYIETDLPQMAALKRDLLSKADLLSARHRVVELNALIDKGEHSLAALVKTLDKSKGVAIITEGLMNYLTPEDARGVWRRIAREQKKFAHGTYLADAYLLRGNRSVPSLILGAMLSVFVRGRMFVHFKTLGDGVEVMHNVGFKSATLHAPRQLFDKKTASKAGTERVLLLEATT